MNHRGRIVEVTASLIELFATRCADRSTLDELAAVVPDEEQWGRSREIFDRIRKKTLRAHSTRSEALVAQCDFEEACAKAFYNLCLPGAPFDPDSPFWIVPKALVLARHLGIPEQEIVRRVAV